jgi:putative transposase
MPRPTGFQLAPLNARARLTRHFRQGRFGAVAMDEEHLAAALRYLALDPVRARLVAEPQDWRWSSVQAHVTGSDDGITATAPVPERYPRFADLIDKGPDPEAFARLRRAERIGRPLGDGHFISRHFNRRLGALTRRSLRPRKPGPKPSNTPET